MKKLCKLMLAFSMMLGVVGVGCKEKQDPNTISQEELGRRRRFCKPHCVAFCKNLVGVCGDYLKQKKRTIEQRKCGIDCFKKCLVHPHAMGQRLVCANRAKTCEHFRNCNRCGKPTCDGKPTSAPAVRKGSAAPTAPNKDTKTGPDNKAEKGNPAPAPTVPLDKTAPTPTPTR